MPLLFIALVPNDVVPLRNVTTPEFTGFPFEVTVAVSVTLAPGLALDEELDRLVVVGSTAVKEN
jgi:hypothetical protein